MTFIPGCGILGTEREVDMKTNERADLVAWLEEHDTYEFLCMGGDESLRVLRRAKVAVEAMDEVITSAARQIRVLANKYRKVGIGDTATDEAIVAELYELIHCA